MKNKSIILLASALLLSTNLANANENNTPSTSSGELRTQYQDFNATRSNRDKLENNNYGSGALKEARDEAKMAKEEIKAKKEELKNENKEKREEIKNNREEFRKDAGELKDIFSDVSDEQKEELKLAREEHKEKIEDIKEKLKNKELTTEEREAIIIELDKQLQSYAEKVKEIVGDNEEVIEYVDSRLELREENKVIRQEIRYNREQYRGEKNELVLEYKETYYGKVGQVVPKLSDDKLEKLNLQIDSIITKTEAKTKLSQEAKDKLVSQLISLKEIIDEELETRDMLGEDLEVELD